MKTRVTGIAAAFVRVAVAVGILVFGAWVIFSSEHRAKTARAFPLPVPQKSTAEEFLFVSDNVPLRLLDKDTETGEIDIAYVEDATGGTFFLTTKGDGAMSEVMALSIGTYFKFVLIEGDRLFRRKVVVIPEDEIDFTKTDYEYRANHNR